MSQAENAVRHYLDFIADPSSIIDKARIASLESELSATTDAIKKLHVTAALEKAKQTDGQAVRSAFVAHANEYAIANGLPASAFRSLGVNDIALAEAGFDLGHGRMKGKGKGKGSANPRRRARKVSKSSIRAYTLATTETFKLQDIMDGAGGSIGTVTLVVKELVAEGAVKDLGSDPSHNGRGRAPKIYSR